jgi:hypothetical protein
MRRFDAGRVLSLTDAAHLREWVEQFSDEKNAENETLDGLSRAVHAGSRRRGADTKGRRKLDAHARERLLLSPQLPTRDAIWDDSSDFSGAFRIGIELRVLQESPDECRQLVLPHRSYHNGAALMPQLGCIEALVPGEKGWLAQTAQ